MINKTVIQTGPNKEIDFSYYDKIQQHTNAYSYQYFNDYDCLKFFQENPIDEYPEVSNIFTTLSINGANRSQLFRYYYLYLKGGVYFDIDLVPLVDLEYLLEDYDYVGVKDCTFRTNNMYALDAFIACKPKDSIMSHMLQFTYNQMLGVKKIGYFFACRELYKQYLSKINCSNYLLLYEDVVCYECKVQNSGTLIKHPSFGDKIDNEAVLFHFPAAKDVQTLIENASLYEEL